MRRWTAVLLAVSVLGCEPTQNEEVPAVEAPGARALTAADSAAAVARAEPLATAVAQGLAQRLQERLAAVGPSGAVDFCATTALALTDSLAAAADPRIEVKRTTLRTRNPRNAPDPLERDALAWFDSVRTATGALPAHMVQAASGGEVRFYRPLVIAQFCTQCHGDPARMDSAVVRVLRERYPADQATGYREGDFRGVLRVSLPAEE